METIETKTSKPAPISSSRSTKASDDGQDCRHASPGEVERYREQVEASRAVWRERCKTFDANHPEWSQWRRNCLREAKEDHRRRKAAYEKWLSELCP